MDFPDEHPAIYIASTPPSAKRNTLNSRVRRDMRIANVRDGPGNVFWPLKV